DGVPAGAIRLAVLAHHYREDWDWTDAGLDAARERLAGWSRAAALSAGPSAEALLAAMRSAIADDLDTPAALAAVDRYVADALTRGGSDPDGPSAMARAVDALLGVDLLA
ncbi:MAG: putative ATP-dependent L-cysteine-D-myo-inosityl 2-amino-2-deoxy-alpha-D-glucopyranoside ligase, partial [Actinomycetota bacterium]